MHVYVYHAAASKENEDVEVALKNDMNFLIQWGR